MVYTCKLDFRNLSEPILSKSIKMEIVRDTLWNRCLTDAMTMYGVGEPTSACFSLANATWKCRMAYKKHEDKKDTRKLIVIDKTPSLVNEQRKPRKMCCAITMMGSPCAFKAVCGEYCKKHRVKDEVIGTQIKIGIH